MRDKEILGLYEAYMEVVENQQLDEGLKSIDTPEKAQGYAIRALGSATKAAFTGDKKTYEKRKKGLKMGQRKAERKAVEEQREQVDLFDYILEHLVAEGYADTNESALVIMANMSEEWRQSIMEGPSGMMKSLASQGKGQVITTQPTQPTQQKVGGLNPIKFRSGMK